MPGLNKNPDVHKRDSFNRLLLYCILPDCICHNLSTVRMINLMASASTIDSVDNQGTAASYTRAHVSYSCLTAQQLSNHNTACSHV